MATVKCSICNRVFEKRVLPPIGRPASRKQTQSKIRPSSCQGSEGGGSRQKVSGPRSRVDLSLMNCYIILDPAPDNPAMNVIGTDPRIALSTTSGAPQPQNSVRITSAKIFVGPAHVTSPTHHQYQSLWTRWSPIPLILTTGVSVWTASMAKVPILKTWLAQATWTVISG